MHETPGRKLFRASIPQNQPPIPTQSIPEGTQALQSPEDSATNADAETGEMPQIAKPPSHNRSIAEVKILKTPSWAFHCRRHNPLAGIETFKLFSFPMFPS